MNKIRLMTEFSHIHHLSESFLTEFYSEYSPVFILNTGRSGSALLQQVFAQTDGIDAHHEASPNLFLQSNFAYHNQDKHFVLKKMFESARIELMLTARVKNLIYLETNQCLVFFLRQISELFPNAKFIHLYRHPGDFVRSAIRKGWHRNDSVWELGRIKMADTQKWQGCSQVEKLSWVWNATHTFIEGIKKEVPEKFFTTRLEDLIKDHSEFNDMLHFIGLSGTFSRRSHGKLFQVKRNELNIRPDEPTNMFKLNEYPKYSEWEHTDKVALKEFVSVLAIKHGYVI